MRIAISPQIFQEQKHGGISRYFTHLCQELDRSGDTVAILSPGIRNAYLGDLDPSLILEDPILGWIDRHPRGIKHRTLWLRDRMIRRTIRRWKPDVIHESYYSNERCAPAGVPTILTVYDMIHELFPEQFAATDPTRLAKKLAVERADHIICISESTRRDLVRILNVPENKTSVVHLATSPPPLTGATDDGGPLSSLSRPYVLFVGERGGYKNFSCLLEAYASSAQLRKQVRVVAFGRPFDAAELRTLSELGLGPGDVEQQGGDDMALDRAYRKALVFVCPSLYEGFGLPVLEAMARGCPVISSQTSSLPEVAGQAAMLFNPHHVEDLQACIEQMVSDSTRRDFLIAEGFQQVQRFSWQKCAQETRVVYQKFAR